MIIEREKRYIVLSQTKKQYGVRRLCKTAFTPETNSETDRLLEFVEEMLSFNDPEADEATRMRDTEIARMTDWETNMQLECITKHLANLRAHPSYDRLIKDISQLITDIEDGMIEERGTERRREQ